MSVRIRISPSCVRSKASNDIVTAAGEIMLRLEFSNADEETRTVYDTRIHARHGQISAVKGYFLDEGDVLETGKLALFGRCRDPQSGYFRRMAG